MQTHSKLAVALAEALLTNAEAWPFKVTDAHRETFAAIIDGRMAANREHLKPQEFAFCPYVTHHPHGPCHWCVVAALREFILLPEDLNV